MAKPRGRKLLKKQKKDEFVPQQSLSNTENNVNVDYHDNNIELDTAGSATNLFFGVLDREELEYFKQAEATLAVDAFESTDEKHQFVTSIIEEAKGKELKLVTSQICSKLMERLILDCDDSQLKFLFQTFNGFFFNIACHKYASHVLETLLVRSTALVEKELLTPTFDNNLEHYDKDDNVVPSMENLFLFMLNEFKPHLKEMMTHQYASHSLRLLILILSSKLLPSSTENNSTLRSKRSKIARKMVDLRDNSDFNKIYQTPESFKLQLRDMLSDLYKDFMGHVESRNDISMTVITKFRELCVDKVASPVIQLIIQVEGIFDRDRSFWRLAFCVGDERDPKEESFVEYLLSDAVGSHFLENVIQFARIKYVERLYRLYMKYRLVKLCKRDTTGAFVVQSLLKILKSKEIKEILNSLVPELNMILNSNMDFAINIIDASNRENNYLREQVVEQLIKKYYRNDPNDEERKNILESCLQLSNSTLGNTRDGDWPTAEEHRRSLFLEELIDYDDKFLEITIEGMLDLPEDKFLQMTCHGIFSHVVEHVLQVKRVDTIKRKQLLNILCKNVVNMSCNAYGSHIVDKLWEFTSKLTLYKERIAAALVKESDKVKNSIYGKQVWKNWQLDKYLRKNYDWKRLIKEQDLELFPESKAPIANPLKRKAEHSNNKRYQQQRSKKPYNSRKRH